MAIDTTQEKHSLITFCQWTMPVVPIASGTLSTEDQKQILRGYPGLTWDEGLAEAVSGGSWWLRKTRRKRR